MGKGITFKPLAEELLRSSDINRERVKRIRQYGAICDEAIQALASNIGWAPPIDRKRIALTEEWPGDGVGIVSDLLTSGIRLSKAKLMKSPSGDAKERLAVNKLSENLISTFERTTSWKGNELHQAIALGLVGVHAMIWTPEGSMKPPATDLLKTATDECLTKILMPAATELKAILKTRQ